MKILVLCSHGENRSRYLADYLRSKGYLYVDYSGVKVSDNKTQKKIADADLLIVVHKKVMESLSQDFDISDKKIIALDVEDRPEEVLPGKTRLDGEAWIAFQEKYVYPKLKEQIDRFIPFE